MLVTSLNFLQASENKLDHNVIVSLGDEEIKNPEIALAEGITGYIEITTVDTPEYLEIEAGSERTVYFSIKYISYSVKHPEVTVYLNSPLGLIVEKTLPDKSRFVLNDYVSYDTEKSSLIIKDGESVVIPVIISIPKETPSISIPLAGLGIHSDISIIDSVEVELVVK
jgi:hypothetical protein